MTVFIARKLDPQRTDSVISTNSIFDRSNAFE